MAQAESLGPAKCHCTRRGGEVGAQPDTLRSQEAEAGASGWLWEGFVCWQAMHFPGLPDNRVHGHISELVEGLHPPAHLGGSGRQWGSNPLWGEANLRDLGMPRGIPCHLQVQCLHMLPGAFLLLTQHPR